jgi:predicted GNAT family N-acyltransferase
MPKTLDIRVSKSLDPDDFEICLTIRREVFVQGQNVPLEIEIDGLDSDCTHFLARVDGDPVGTARLREVGGEAKAERVAVLEAWRGYGIGRRLMEAVEEEARSGGLPGMVLNAQVSVIPFYEGLDYQAEGDVFLEAGIEHRTMRKAL